MYPIVIILEPLKVGDIMLDAMFEVSDGIMGFGAAGGIWCHCSAVIECNKFGTNAIFIKIACVIKVLSLSRMHLPI